jgi:hypothetical protein
MKTYAQRKLFIDTYINTNGIAAITGAIANEALIDQLLADEVNLSFDTTRPYRIGGMLVYTGAGFNDIYVCNVDTDPMAVFDATNFTRISRRTKKILVNDNYFTGIEVGTNVFTHNIGNADYVPYLKTAEGYQIPLEIVHNTELNTITITSLVEYAGAIVLITEI